MPTAREREAERQREQATRERKEAERTARIAERLLTDLQAAKLRGAEGKISPDGVKKLEEIAHLSAATALRMHELDSERRSALRVAGLGATTELTKAGFQALIVINGGAIGAILAFIGSLRSGSSGDAAAALMQQSSSGLHYFAAGLVLSVVGIGLAFWAQIAIQERKDTALGFCRFLAFGVGFLSLLSFLHGAFLVAEALASRAT